MNPNQEKVQKALIELLTVTDQANAAPDRATFTQLNNKNNVFSPNPNPNPNSLVSASMPPVDLVQNHDPSGV